MRALLRHRNFRLLFLGQGLSTIGDRIVFVALALYVTDIGTPTDVGLVLACHAVPLVGFLLIGGVWADRLPRHLVVVTTDLIRFGLHALLAVLIFSGAVEIWHIAVIEAAFGTAEAFYRPAYTGLVPQTVPEEEIQPAKAAFGTLETVAEFLGPALATLLVLGIGPGWAFAIDAATFLVSAAFLVRLRPRARGEPVERTTVLRELRDGWSEVRSRAWVWAIIGAASLSLLVGFGPWMTLGPTVSIELYDTRAVYGILVSAMGAGTIAGALIGFRWRPRHPMRAGVLLCLPWSFAGGLFALGLPVGVLVVLFVLAGARHRAVRDLVGDRAGRADPAAHALARDRLRLDGLARPAAARLRARRAARRGAGCRRGGRRRQRAVAGGVRGEPAGARRVAARADHGSRSVPVTSTTTSPLTRTRPDSISASRRLGRPISTPCVTSSRSRPSRAWR